MSIEVWSMLVAGLVALAVGLILAWPRYQAARGAGKALVLGPIAEAAALAVFAVEHFTDARGLMDIVPQWLPFHLFWTYFVGVALLAAAVSFLAMRCVPWSASLLALLFLIIVITVDLPGLPKGLHDRFFWILTVRETCFAAGAMVLAGSTWPRRNAVAQGLIVAGRFIVAAVCVFYGMEHFLHPDHVPGVPLEKLTPAWVPAPALLAYAVGAVLVLAGIGLLLRKTARLAAAIAGLVVFGLALLFYGPILVMELHTPLAVEGLNYVYDTMLFAGTLLLAGRGTEAAAS